MAAFPTCMKCNAHTFEAKMQKVEDYRYNLVLVCCTSCGGVAGVTTQYDAGVQGLAFARELDAIKKTLEQMDMYLVSIQNHLSSRK